MWGCNETLMWRIAVLSGVPISTFTLLSLFFPALTVLVIGSMLACVYVRES